ncbi:homeodomain-interacting protein kinase 4 [Platysternon megacephalum]|uniref:Homeodomain-interacting protein kinase 4 n=1 Tax=Platysternon megacephalum TaxID=55544 RepID=A0A4D9DMP6_9SAUR|nr:homeodomain-interacting protein kinase 4 [Platysternon megacephalum]
MKSWLILVWLVTFAGVSPSSMLWGALSFLGSGEFNPLSAGDECSKDPRAGDTEVLSTRDKHCCQWQLWVTHSPESQLPSGESVPLEWAELGSQTVEVARTRD